MATNIPTTPSAQALFAAFDKSSSASTSSKFIRKQIQTLGWRNRHSQDEFYPIQVKDIYFSVKQVQRGEVEGTYGTGATVWPAAMVLTKYLEMHPHLLKNRTVIDLGSGTGITSIAASVLGAKHVVCTDGEPNVVRLAQENVDRVKKDIGSESYDRIHVQKYWWGQDRIESTTECDIVLVADCVLPKLYPIAPLVDAIDTLLQTTPEAIALLSYEHRYFPEYDPQEKFESLANAKNLVVEVIPMKEQDSVYSVDDIEVWKVRRR